LRCGRRYGATSGAVIESQLPFGERDGVVMTNLKVTK